MLLMLLLHHSRIWKWALQFKTQARSHSPHQCLAHLFRQPVMIAVGLLAVPTRPLRPAFAVVDQVAEVVLLSERRSLAGLQVVVVVAPMVLP